jgi:predicted RNase H-like HicB family nuclease
MKVYDTWVKYIDGWFVHYCELCNAEIAGKTPEELHEQLDKHKLFVACSKGY